ncbi:asparagine synthase (glutamine-hydrolyzing) [Amycolatopsis rubida]|uniref:asparagine synthase (glutamine-hydrolyzing) n=1 Tax=Amycolatopsis rubida TaxID=112413 RepID=A0A1I5TMS7_9PSEU|nr:asparagine synthase (glutamine-hydrolyzing) [Amycolatopsis rubida]SFP84343.1 asparagine synthase (glutamine-hydrolysing) [Amycolatopsis rubida]
MCGITGWVDFERDLRSQSDTVRAMAAALAHRGPDAESVWTDRHAALGHRRLAVIDREGGEQPMAAEESGQVPAVLTYNGEVCNFSSLRAELTARGHRFRTRGDTEVVLRSYLEWGEHCVDHLDGMFAFAVWDPRRRRLLLARDRLGVKPLCYAPLGRGVVFGSEVKALLAHPLVDAVVDAGGLAELLSYVATPGHGVYRGIHEVPPGTVVIVAEDSITSRAYWSLRPTEHTDDWDATVETVRELLADSVAAHLVSDVPLCTLLSGGVDSSAIVALAARATDHRPRTFAVDFEGHGERFRKDVWHEGADAPFAELVAGHVGADHERIVLSTADLADPLVDAAALRAQDLPRPIPDMDRSLFLLLRAVRSTSTVALAGEIADELFGGYKSFHDPTLTGTGNFPWVSLNLAIGPHGMGNGLLDQALLREVDVAGYTADRYADMLGEMPVLPGETVADRSARLASYAHLTRWLPLLLARDDRLSMATGLELRVPFCDHRLVEYAFSIPPAMRTSGGIEKAVLRAAVSDLLPDEVLRRPKSPFPVTQDAGYGHVLRHRLEAVATDRDSPVRPLLDEQACDRLLKEARPVAVRGWGERRDVEMLLQLDSWLRAYRVRLDV